MKASESSYSVSYGKKTVSFRLKFSARKTLEISVHPDLSVSVTAPKESPLEKIKRKVQNRADWILKQQDYFSQFLPQQPPRQFVSGETHSYLGRQYRLKIEEAAEESVKLKFGRISVTVKNKKNSLRVAELVNDWMLRHARKRFALSLLNCNERLRKSKIQEPQLRIRKMTKRWGSCTSKGVIYLNPELIKAPSHCIDYVVMHELCHVRFPHHGKDFYALLNRVMPDWEARKKRLEKMTL